MKPIYRHIIEKIKYEVTKKSCSRNFRKFPRYESFSTYGKGVGVLKIVYSSSLGKWHSGAQSRGIGGDGKTQYKCYSFGTKEWHADVLTQICLDMGCYDAS